MYGSRDTPAPEPLVAEAVEAFLAGRVNPGAAERDRACAHIPREMLREAAGHGLLAATLPRDVGGEGWGSARWARAIRRIAYLCDDLAFPFILGYQQGVAHRILASARADLITRYVRPMALGETFGSFCWSEGADAFSFRSVARRTARGYVLHGTKGPASVGLFADFFLVYVRDQTQGDLVAIILERGDAGLTVERFDPMGLRGTGQAEVRFDGVEVGLERVLVPADAVGDAQSFLNARRVVIPCMVLGRLEALLEAVVDDLRERVRYGVPLTEMQAIQATLGRMHSAIEACRASVERMLDVIARDEAAGPASPVDALWHPIVAATKHFIVDQSLAVVGMAQHVLGGRWYFDRWPFGRWMRDIIGFVSTSGTQGILEVDLGVMAGAEGDRRAARRRHAARREGA